MIKENGFSRMIKFHIATALAVTILAACGSSSGSAGPNGAKNLRRVTLEEANEMLQNPPEGLVVLDVRTPQELAGGVISSDVANADALSADFVSELEKLDKDAPYLMYCRSGNRSAGALKTMESLGFTDVAEMEGGIAGWVASGYEVLSSN